MTMFSNPWLQKVKDQYGQEATKQEFTDGEVKQLRGMLDDPKVSNEDKQNALYALSNSGKLSDEEAFRYASQVGADPIDVMQGGQALDENIENARKSLTKHNQQGVKNAQQALDQGGFATSDEIVDQAKPALKLFDDFYPRYQRAGGKGGAGGSSPSSEGGVVTPEMSAPGSAGEGGGAKYSHSGVDPDSIRQGMDEFRGVEFKAFHTDAEMMKKAHTAVSDGRNALDTAWDHTSDWTGDAKGAAEQVNQGLSQGAEKLTQALEVAPENITKTIDDGVQQSIVNFVKAVLELYGDGTVSGLTLRDVDAFIKAKEELPAAIEELEKKVEEMENKGLLDHFVDFVTNPLNIITGLVGIPGALIGYTFAQEITEDNIREELEKYKGTLEEAKKKLQDFCADYESKANSVHKQASTYVDGIQKNYTSLIESLTKAIDPDPFDKQDKGKDGGQQDKGKGGDQGTGPGQSGGGPAGTPSGGAPAGGAPAGGAPSGGAPGGGSPDAGGAPGAGDEAKPGEQGKNPVTGEDLEVDPKTGEPYPIDPETGEAIKDADGQDTMTVEKGDRKFEMTEPGEDGKMGISVEDGSGKPKEYNLDFGGEKGGADGQPPTGEGAGKGEDFGPGGSGEPGAGDGEGAGKGDGDGKVYRPGPDGKIHIQDGDLKITAEQPDGPDGPTKVTVDDGNPPPTTYTLGEKDGADGSGSDSADGGANGDGAGREGLGGLVGEGDARDAGVPEPGGQNGESGVHTMPAEGENPFGGGGADGAVGQEGAGGGSVSSGPGADGGSEVAGAGADSGGDSAADNPGDRTRVAAASGGDDGGSGLAAGGAALGGDAASAEGAGGGAASSAGDSLSPGAMSGGAQQAPAAAGVGTAPGGDGPAAPAGPSQGSGAGAGGGMMGMGAMGGAGGGGQGGDQERTSSYRVDGDIFGNSGGGQRISGSLDEDAERSVRFDR